MIFESLEISTQFELNIICSIVMVETIKLYVIRSDNYFQLNIIMKIIGNSHMPLIANETYKL